MVMYYFEVNVQNADVFPIGKGNSSDFCVRYTEIMYVLVSLVNFYMGCVVNFEGQ